MDEVAKNSIWIEQCKKEKQAHKLNEAFAITNPNKMNLLPEKPNYVIPNAPNPDPEMILNTKKELNELCNIKNSEKSINQISNIPMTANQTYGFFHNEKVINKPKLHRPRKMDVITKYADFYVQSIGRSPFATQINNS